MRLFTSFCRLLLERAIRIILAANRAEQALRPHLGERDALGGQAPAVIALGPPLHLRPSAQPSDHLRARQGKACKHHASGSARGAAERPAV